MEPLFDHFAKTSKRIPNRKDGNANGSTSSRSHILWYLSSRAAPRYELHNNKQFYPIFLSASFSRFDRLPFPALIFVRKTFFFCLFHVEGELWLIYKFPSFFFCLFNKAQESFFWRSLCASSLSAEEIKDNKLYRIGIKMKILLYNKFCSACKCVYASVCLGMFFVQGTSEWVGKEKTDGTKLKKWNTLGKVLAFRLRNKNASWRNGRVRWKQQKKRRSEEENASEIYDQIKFLTKIIALLYVHTSPEFSFFHSFSNTFPPKGEKKKRKILLDAFFKLPFCWVHIFCRCCFFGWEIYST